MEKKKAVVSWSTGKDSAYAYYVAEQSGEYDIVGLLTTVTGAFQRVSMHGTREVILDAQAASLGKPVHKVQIPWPCTDEIYEATMAEAVEQLKVEGVTHVIFGDLYLEDIRTYREEQMSGTGLTCVFPLWGMDTTRLSEEMLASGLNAILVCIDPKALNNSFAGRVYDQKLVADLPEGADPCGENGEFHTAVVAGPMFDAPIAYSVGEVVERSGFVYADVLPGGATSEAKVNRHE